jgi:hypothetical protein
MAKAERWSCDTIPVHAYFKIAATKIKTFTNMALKTAG